MSPQRPQEGPRGERHIEVTQHTVSQESFLLALGTKTWVSKCGLKASVSGSSRDRSLHSTQRVRAGGVAEGQQ